VQGEERGNIKGKGGDAEKEKREGGEKFLLKERTPWE